MKQGPRHAPSWALGPVQVLDFFFRSRVHALALLTTHSPFLSCSLFLSLLLSLTLAAATSGSFDYHV